MRYALDSSGWTAMSGVAEKVQPEMEAPVASAAFADVIFQVCAWAALPSFLPLPSLQPSNRQVDSYSTWCAYLDVEKLSCHSWQLFDLVCLSWNRKVELSLLTVIWLGVHIIAGKRERARSGRQQSASSLLHPWCVIQRCSNRNWQHDSIILL